MVEAAPQAQPKTIWNAQTGVVQLRVLLGFCFTNRICTQCLDLGHNFKNCPSEDAVTCPCGSTFNISICCVTDDCRLRKNWNETNNNNTILSNNQKIGSNSVMVNGAKLGQAILPIQNVISNSKGND